MNEKKLLIEAAKVFGIQSQIKNIFLVHPLLELMSQKLAAYIGLYAIGSDGKALLAHALNDATAKYLAAIDDGKDEDQALPCFIRSLLESGTLVFNQQISIETPNGDVMWQPFSSGLTEFVNTYKEPKLTVEFKPSAIKKSIAIAFVSMWLVPSELLNSELWASLLNEIEA
jgi:hypothetical protein